MEQPFDNPFTGITPLKFNAENFLEWSQSLKSFIIAQGKMGLLDGSTAVPKTGDPNYSAWEAEDATVMFWLLYTMEPKTRQLFMYYPTAKRIWDTVNAAYGIDKRNTAQKYLLWSKIRETKQGNMSVTNYYNLMNRLWREYGLYSDDIKWETSDDRKKFQKIQEQERVFQFLDGLNNEFHQDRCDLLLRRASRDSDLPSLGEVYDYLRWREKEIRENQNAN